MANLTSQDEQKLLAGVKRAVALIDSEDLSPDEAMCKAAKELSFQPGFLKAACAAFNTGRQLAQWESSADVLDKMADFPLANYENVSNMLWGEKTAAARPPQHAAPVFGYEDLYRKERWKTPITVAEKVAETREKTAEASDTVTRKAWNAYQNAGRTVAEFRREKHAAYDRLNFQLHQLSSYFKKASYDRVAFAPIDAIVRATHGSTGAALMDSIAEQFPREKRAADYSAGWSGFAVPADYSKPPLSYVQDILKTSQQHQEFAEKLAAAVADQRKAELEFSARAMPTRQAEEQPVPLSMNLMATVPAAVAEKQASVFDTVRSFSSHVNSQADRSVEDQIRELESPEHVNELRKIRAQTALTSMMSDPDNPLSQHDPEAVLQAYNELTQLSPSVADQPGALQPMLQKRLMGNVEPFEVGETLKMEEGLQKTHPTVQMPKPVPSPNKVAADNILFNADSIMV